MDRSPATASIARQRRHLRPGGHPATHRRGRRAGRGPRLHAPPRTAAGRVHPQCARPGLGRRGEKGPRRPLLIQ
eukprot:2817277-Lingulodinium_polyedra.AAC.1